MDILLIGGTGILSTDVCQHALNKGMTVYCLNRGLQKQRLPKGAHLISADIRNKESVVKKITKLKFDVVVDFLSYTPTQLEQTLSIFADKCDQYIFISSAVVYQKKDESDIITEDFPIKNTTWKYAKNKANCELLLKKFCASSKLNYTIVRPYVTYGNTRVPFGVTSDRCSWSLPNRILTGKPIVLWDGGQAVCTLTHAKDFAVAMVGLFKNHQAYFQSYHITSNGQFTWREVLQKIELALNKKAVVVDMPTAMIERYMPESKGSLSGDKATNMRFDNSKIRSVVPEFMTDPVSFETGIQQTIDYFLANKDARKIDFVWDGRIDRMLKKYSKYKQIDVDYSSFEMRCFDPENCNKENQRNYRIGQNVLLYAWNRLITKIK